jgi:hypothetical protein
MNRQRYSTWEIETVEVRYSETQLLEMRALAGEHRNASSTGGGSGVGSNESGYRVAAAAPRIDHGHG